MVVIMFKNGMKTCQHGKSALAKNLHIPTKAIKLMNMLAKTTPTLISTLYIMISCIRLVVYTVRITIRRTLLDWVIFYLIGFTHLTQKFLTELLQMRELLDNLN